MMSSIFKKALGLVTGQVVAAPAKEQVVLQMPKNRPFKKRTERELLQMESYIGAQLFGDVPAGHRREFFCLDPHTWIWHEESVDHQTGEKKLSTTKYEVSDKGILKVQEGSRYSYVQGAELRNLLMATRLYYEQVARGVYSRDPHTGRKLA